MKWALAALAILACGIVGWERLTTNIQGIPITDTSVPTDGQVIAYSNTNRSWYFRSGAAPTGAASGGLTGSYPAPSINGNSAVIQINPGTAFSVTTTTGNVTGSVTLGTNSNSACAGNDARLSDTRMPTAGSVTAASMAPTAGLTTTHLAADAGILGSQLANNAAIVVGQLSSGAAGSGTVATANGTGAVTWEAPTSTAVSGPTTGAYQGLTVTCYDSGTVTVTAAGITLNSTTSTTPMWVENVNVTSNTTTTNSGVGGLDIGGEQSTSSWYAVYLVGKGNAGASPTIGCVLSLNGTAPAMPTGYTHYRRVGYARVSSGGGFYKFLQQNQNVQYGYTFTAGEYGAGRVVSNGGSTSWVTVDCSAVLPPTAIGVTLGPFLATGTYVYFRAPGWPAGGGGCTTLLYTDLATVHPGTVLPLIINTSSISYYSSGTSGLYLDIIGYKDKL